MNMPMEMNNGYITGISVSEMVKDTKYEGYLLVRASDQRTSNNGKKYLDMTLGDKTGDVNAKVWDENAQPPKSGTVIKVRAALQEYNGRLQMKIERMRPAEEKDGVDMGLLVQSAPRSSSDMRSEIDETIENMQSEELKKILRELLAMTGEALAYFPAAQKVHHAERCGLLHHTTSMLRVAKAILPNYPFLNADLLLAGVIAHDLSKVVEMKADETGNVSDYTVRGLLLGHLVHGAIQVQEAARRAGVEGEYVMLLQHMLISHHGVPEFGSPRPPMFPEAELLHMIDDMDAKMNEMENIQSRIAPGVFSEKIWSLDRRMYHPDLRSEEPSSGEELPFEDEKAADGKNAAARPDSQRRFRDSEAAYNGLL